MGMTREEAIKILRYNSNVIHQTMNGETDPKEVEALDMAIKALEQESCEMTAEEYRQRMIQAFHNADADELIAVCVFPTEKEFEHLEWLLKNHYKQEACEDAISRQAAIDAIRKDIMGGLNYEGILTRLPSVKPKYTDEEIQKMQDLEQVQIQKAYEIGKAEGVEIKNCISRETAACCEGSAG